MNEPMPTAQECKRNAINALAQVAAINPDRDEAVDVAAGVIAIAQVWATLATVPDEIVVVREPPADTSWIDDHPISSPPRGWKSPGGAGQWNG